MIDAQELGESSRLCIGTLAGQDRISQSAMITLLPQNKDIARYEIIDLAILREVVEDRLDDLLA